MTVAQAVLTRPTLVLNRNWQAIQVTTVKEAIGLVAKGSARIIDAETYEAHDLFTWNDVSRAKAAFSKYVIRSAKMALLPPEVIVLTEYAGMGERSVVFSRRNIFKRDRYMCQFCLKQFRSELAMKELTIDHVLPKSRGGRSSWENCVLACLACNKRKADRTPEEAGMKLKRRPKKPSRILFTMVAPGKRMQSWQHFLSEAYWNVELEP
jgi:5-methylcytosine-specific restriction endonuclease McrA